MAELTDGGLEVLPQLQGYREPHWISPAAHERRKPRRTQAHQLTAAPWEMGLSLELNMATEKRGGEIHLSASLSDSDQLHLDFFEALGT